jgi:fumarate hydratase class II
MDYRIEKDTMGEVKVPADAYYGAQTQRSIENFNIARDTDKMPIEIIRAFAYLKKAAALTNFDAQILPGEKCELIMKVCDEILEGSLDTYFPLVVWQTGSGTQSNMNVNEVIAYRGHVLSGGKLSDKEKVLQPNDDVNKSQSSNDTFPTAMHIAAYMILVKKTIPALEQLRDVLKSKSQQFMHIVKIGRTHFMDATPLTLGQEFSGYVSQLDHGIKAIRTHSGICLSWHWVVLRLARHQHAAQLFPPGGGAHCCINGVTIYNSRKQVRSAGRSRCDCRIARRAENGGREFNEDCE